MKQPNFRFDSVVEINGDEIEVEVTGTITPGSPMVRYYPDGSGDPGSDPEVNEMDVTVDGLSIFDELTSNQIERLSEQVWDNLQEVDYPDYEPEYDERDEPSPCD